MLVFDDYLVLDDCQNIQESLGEICVQCNKCGRFNKKDEDIKNEGDK
jgi:hypothetical protein